MITTGFMGQYRQALPVYSEPHPTAPRKKSTYSVSDAALKRKLKLLADFCIFPNEDTIADFCRSVSEMELERKVLSIIDSNL